MKKGEKIIADIPEGVQEFARGCFTGVNVSEVRIPASVLTIKDDAFKENKSLQTVVFAKGSQMREIGNYAFNSCKSLTTISLPEDLQSIG